MSQDRGSFSWSAGVPIATNPVFLRNALSILVWTMVCLFGVILATQAFFGSWPGLDQVRSALMIVFKAGSVVSAIYLAVVFALLGNRFMALFRVGENGVRCDTVRIRRGDWNSSMWASSPFTAPDNYDEIRSTSRLVTWESVSGFKRLRKIRTIVLTRGSWTVMRLFCPDEATYLNVLECVRRHIGDDEIQRKKDEEVEG